MSTPNASIILPVFNGSAHLPYLWESISTNIDERFELIIVDDGSTEDILCTLPSKLKSARLLRNETPKGYAGAVNQGLQQSGGYHKILINSDIILAKEALANMVLLLETTSGTGVVGAKPLYPQTGALQHYGLSFTETRKFHIYTNSPSGTAITAAPREVQAVTFALAGIHGDVYQRIGGLDTSYYNGSEDIDYCFRVREAGYRILVHPDVEAYHWEGLSGESRHLATSHNDVLFWRRWGKSVASDFKEYLSASWTQLNIKLPKLGSYRFMRIDLTNEPPESDSIAAVDAICDVAIDEKLRVMATGQIWLPLALPGDLLRSPQPFIYIVRAFPQLNTNHYWFASRRSYVEFEVVVDLYGNCLSTSDNALVPTPINLKHPLDCS